MIKFCDILCVCVRCPFFLRSNPRVILAISFTFSMSFTFSLLVSSFSLDSHVKLRCHFPPYRSVYVHHCSPIHCICLVSTPTQHIISWPHLTWKTLKAKANNRYHRAVAIWTQPRATFGQPSAEIYTEGRAHYEIYPKLDSLIADLTYGSKKWTCISNNIWAWNDVQRTEPLLRWFPTGLLQL